MRLIILAAGQGFKLDGFNKIFLKDPNTKETLISKYMGLFSKYEITIVTGYKAATIMSEYPNLDYAYNSDWRTTGNSYSLSLALDERPCIIISCDLFFDEKMVRLIEESPPNSVIISYAENKSLDTVRCKTKEDNIVESIYHGQSKNNDPETIGIFKISDPNILREWKKNCALNQNVFAAVNLPLDKKNIIAVDKKDLPLYDINTPLDYLNFIKKIKNEK